MEDLSLCEHLSLEPCLFKHIKSTLRKLKKKKKKPTAHEMGLHRLANMATRPPPARRGQEGYGQRR